MRTPKKPINSTHQNHPSSNWKTIQSKLPKIPANVKAKQALKRQLRNNNNILPHHQSSSHNESQDPVSVSLCQILQQGVSGSKLNEIGRFLAIDCEMVGVGPNGSESVLARVSIVNYYGAVILDSYVSPKEKVTDYRTWVSGIKPEHLADASSFSEVTSKVAQLIKDKVLIGHAITNDLQALLLKHPRNLIRDTSKYAPLRALAGTKFPSLKKLAALLLRLEIQASAHSSVDDARATMAVYRTQKDEWEASLRPQHSSIAPLFRPASRPKAVIATPTPPKPASPPPVAPVASSSKSTLVVNDAKKKLNSKETHVQESPKVTNKSETSGKIIETPDAEVSLIDNRVTGHTLKASEPTKDIDQPNRSPPNVIKSTTAEFKKPRTANLRLSATLQHIRNEQETAEKSATQALSLPTK
ncbi:ribonuclease H-like domain-containing protein [Melampsora americana]|nr:ribonuclease H-like domain-containing protein [Melampsora americana]